MPDLSVSMTVGDIVGHDLRAAAVLARYGIDFCCGGRRSLDEACKANGVDAAAVLGDLEALERADATTHDMTSWPVDALVDYIVTRHHAYAKRQIPAIMMMLDKLVEAHGERYPAMPRIAATFASLASELTHHMLKEEQILFPYIRSMADVRSDDSPRVATPFGTVRNPIRMMEDDHQQAAAELWMLRVLSNGFAAPEDACVTWRACFGELAAFERDLHEHVHLENNVLFPAAARLEDELR
jgi:regulator of cell morphogenesis and NO signaling